MPQEPFYTDLKYVHEAVSGDMPTISGLDNLKERLIRRYITRRGSFAFRPEYGASLPDYQNEVSSIDTQKKMFNAIREQSLLDPGVKEVKEIAFSIDEDNPAATRILVKIKPVGYDDFSFTVSPFALEEA